MARSLFSKRAAHGELATTYRSIPRNAAQRFGAAGLATARPSTQEGRKASEVGERSQTATASNGTSKPDLLKLSPQFSTHDPGRTPEGAALPGG
jgi:hypothetical protein